MKPATINTRRSGAHENETEICFCIGKKRLYLSLTVTNTNKFEMGKVGPNDRRAVDLLLGTCRKGRTEDHKSGIPGSPVFYEE